MTHLVKALTNVLAETLDGNDNKVMARVTAANQYNVSFPPYAAMGALVDNLEEYNPQDPWFSKDKAINSSTEIARSAITVLDNQYSNDGMLMQVIDDNTLYLFYTGHERCIKIEVVAPTSEVVSPEE